MSDRADWLLYASLGVAGWLAVVAVIETKPPKPIRADPQPVSTCAVTQPQWITPDTFVMPPSGPRDLQAYYPCKILKMEKDV